MTKRATGGDEQILLQCVSLHVQMTAFPGACSRRGGLPGTQFDALSPRRNREQAADRQTPCSAVRLDLLPALRIFSSKSREGWEAHIPVTVKMLYLSVQE